MWLRQSTASQEIKLGPFLDSTDGNTQKTALTIANTDIKLTKGGATTEVNKTSGGATHVANGRYSAVLDATDTDTLGNLEIDVHVSGALAVRRSYIVLPGAVYDALVLGTDVLTADVVQWLGTAVATPTVAGVPEVDLTHVAGATTNVAALATNVDAILTDTADMQPKLGTPAGATMSVDIAAIQADIDIGLQYTAGTVVDAAATTTSFKTSLTQVNNFWNDAMQIFTSGALSGQARPVQSFANVNGVITVDEPFTSAPANGDAFVIKADHIHPIAQIAAGVAGTVLTESYAADGAAPTLAQAVIAIQQFLQERAVAGTTLTVKKLDGTTAAMTFTLNDASQPTSITRAT